jgi:hypothetical protein
MAQELKSINLVAPAFQGINTEDAPLAQDPSFAETADNAVIDKRGRIAARKGHLVITTDKTQLGSDFLSSIKEFRDDVGNTEIFSVGNNKIFSGTTTLADETPGSYTITADDGRWSTLTTASTFSSVATSLLFTTTLQLLIPAALTGTCCN